MIDGFGKGSCSADMQGLPASDNSIVPSHDYRHNPAISANRRVTSPMVEVDRPRLLCIRHFDLLAMAYTSLYVLGLCCWLSCFSRRKTSQPQTCGLLKARIVALEHDKNLSKSSSKLGKSIILPAALFLSSRTFSAISSVASPLFPLTDRSFSCPIICMKSSKSCSRRCSCSSLG